MFYRLTIETEELRHDLRLARHPSESPEYLACRLLAYGLHYRPGLVFSGQVCRGDEPALTIPAVAGSPSLRIEIGRPSAKKLRRDLRLADRVIIYLYRQPERLNRLLAAVKGAERLTCYHFERSFLAELEKTLEQPPLLWRLCRSGGAVTVNRIAGHRTRLYPS